MDQQPRPRMLGDYLAILWRRKLVFTVTAVLCAGLAAGWSLAQHKVYRASTQVIIDVYRNPSLFGSTPQSPTDAKRKLLNELAIMTGVDVRSGVQDSLDLPAPPPRAITATSTNSDVVTLSVRGANGELAASIANEYVTIYNELKAQTATDELTKAVQGLQEQIDSLQQQIETLDTQIAASATDDDTTREAQRRDLLAQQSDFQQTLEQRQIDAQLNDDAATVVHPAQTPTEPVQPTPLKTTSLGLLLGLVLGAALAMIRDRYRRVIDRVEDLESLPGLPPVVTIVPAVKTTGPQPLAVTQPRHDAVEAYRWLRTSVEFANADRQLKVVQLTSSMPVEGKTTTAANLAVVLATSGSRVVLVDADLRRPRLHQVFELPNTAGLVDALVGTALTEVVQSSPVGPDVLTSGKTPYNPRELLAGRRFGEVLAELRSTYDYVVVDTPPVLPVSEALAVSRHVDGVILVVRAKQSQSKQLQRTVEEFQLVQAPMMGIVLNGLDPRHATYGYGAYGYDAAAKLRAQRNDAN